MVIVKIIIEKLCHGKYTIYYIGVINSLGQNMTRIIYNKNAFGQYRLWIVM